MKVRISGWNGAFGGMSDAYLGLDGLKETAAAIRGFPRNVQDVRKIMLDSERVSMRFYCVDSAGHASVDSTIESASDATGKTQSATFSLPIEASAVDTFVEDLGRLSMSGTGIAILRGRSEINVGV
jgi:hypothetical protein